MQRGNTNYCNRIKRWLKRYWGTVCLVSAVFVLCLSGTWAAYTNFSVARRVVSVKDGSTVLFTSNLLFTEDKLVSSDSYRNRKITLNSSNQFSLEIYNYVFGDKTTYNNHSIEYLLQIKLISQSLKPSGYIVSDGSQQYALTLQDGAYSVSLDNQTLAGNKLSKNSYIIQVPEEDKNQVYLCIEAVPTEQAFSATNYKKLGAGILIGDMVLEKNWSGRILDLQDGLGPNQYDGFNYEITGFGQGTVVLTWDASRIDISPWFEENISEYIVDSSNESVQNGWKLLKFRVGGENQPSAFQTQFYWVSEPPSISKDQVELQKEWWKKIKDSILLTYSEG